VLNHKFELLGRLAFDNPKPVIDRLSALETKSAADVAGLLDFPLEIKGRFE